MFNFLKDLTSELTAYPLEQKLELENFCFHIGKLHHELVRMPEENAAAILGHFSSLRELLDFYSAAQELRPVLPPEPVQAVQPVQDRSNPYVITLRAVYIWQHAEDLENLAQLPDAHNWRGALRFNVQDEQERAALESLLLKRIAARRVSAFCFALDYSKADETTNSSGEAWRCLPDTLEFSTARVPAEYKLMGAAPASRACQVFAAEYLTKMNALKRVHLDI